MRKYVPFILVQWCWLPYLLAGTSTGFILLLYLWMQPVPGDPLLGLTGGSQGSSDDALPKPAASSRPRGGEGLSSLVPGRPDQAPSTAASHQDRGAASTLAGATGLDPPDSTGVAAALVNLPSSSSSLPPSTSPPPPESSTSVGRPQPRGEGRVQALCKFLGKLLDILKISPAFFVVCFLMGSCTVCRR